MTARTMPASATGMCAADDGGCSAAIRTPDGLVRSADEHPCCGIYAGVVGADELLTAIFFCISGQRQRRRRARAIAAAGEHCADELPSSTLMLNQRPYQHVQAAVIFRCRIWHRLPDRTSAAYNGRIMPEQYRRLLLFRAERHFATKFGAERVTGELRVATVGGAAERSSCVADRV